MPRTLIAIAAVFVAVVVLAAEPPLTNADIVKLVKAGTTSEVIIAKIKASEAAFATDTDSLVALGNEKVPPEVVQAMVARAAQAAGAPQAATSGKPEAAKVVVQGIYRTRGICTARGELTMTATTFAFKPTEKSPLCSEDAFGKSAVEFAWTDVARVCYEYAASGTMEVWLKNGQDMSFKSTRGEMENLAARIKSLYPDLLVRCE